MYFNRYVYLSVTVSLDCYSCCGIVQISVSSYYFILIFFLKNSAVMSTKHVLGEKYTKLSQSFLKS